MSDPVQNIISVKNSQARQNPFCYVCNNRAGVSPRNACDLFAEKISSSSDTPPSYILSTILNRPLCEDSVHSYIICKKCFKLCTEFEEVEQRLLEIRLDIIRSFNTTATKYNVSPVVLEDDEVEAGPETDEESEDITNFENNTNSKEDKMPSLIFSNEDDQISKQNSLENDNIDIINGELVKNRITMVYQKKQNSTEQHEENIEPDEFELNEQMKEEYFDEDNANMVEIMTENDCDEYENLIVHESHILEPDDNSIDDSADKLLNTTASESDNSNIVNIKLEPGEENIEKQDVRKKKRSSTKSMKMEKETQLNSEDIFLRNDDNFMCKLCPENGDTLFIYDCRTIGIHIKSTHNIRIYFCDVCGADFIKRNELAEHLDEHVAATEDGEFQCETCNRIFNNLKLFRIHKRMHYSNSKSWECNQCNKKYTSKNLLDEHLNMHTGQRPFKCPHCTKDFASKYTLSAHLKIHSNRPRPHKCKTCNKSFYSGQNLYQHEKIHSGVKEYICSICRKAFSTQHNLEVHKIVHSGYKPFICRTCNKAFARRAEIKDHERTHTGEKPFRCDICDANFAQRSNLQSHKRATHFNDKRYKCEECGRCFKRRRLLEYHIKATHTGERPYKCDVCASTFVYPEHYKKHLRIHSGVKPYSCEVCGKHFNSRDNRNAHRFIHSDKKPYECLVCGQGFMRKPLLFLHMQQFSHLNDTIVVNQPRITNDDDEEELKNDNRIGNNLKTEQIIEYIEEHIEEEIAEDSLIIDGPVQFTDQITAEELSAEEILNNGDLSEAMFVSDDGQFIETQNGDVQFVKIRLANDSKDTLSWMKVV